MVLLVNTWGGFLTARTAFLDRSDKLLMLIGYIKMLLASTPLVLSYAFVCFNDNLELMAFVLV